MAAKKKTAAKKAAKKAPAKKAAAKKAAKKKVAKKAAKKAPAKKPAKKKTAVRMEDPDKLKPVVFKSRFGAKDKKKVLTGMTENVRKSVDIVSERSKTKPVHLLTPAMLRRALFPYEELYFQWMLASIGFRTPSAFEVIAPEYVGSTTFVMDWIGRLADQGCYSIYCECEGKQIDMKRAKRLMDRDPKIATAKLNATIFSKARTLAQLYETILKVVPDIRKRCDSNPETKGNPIWFFADPSSALMSKSEAQGIDDFGLSPTAKKEQPKEVEGGSNFEHAKFAQKLARKLPAIMEKFNCNFVFVSKQNDKIDMEQKRGPKVFAPPSPLKNDTRLGGRALKRLCAYRLTMLNIGDIRNKTGDKEIYGHHLKIMLIKSSYGPRARTCEASLFFDNFVDDREDYQAPGFSYAEKTASWMVKKGFLGTTVEKELYTCDALGCVAVPARELYQALLNNPEQIEHIGSVLDIEGYAHPPKVIPPKPDDDDEDEDEEVHVEATAGPALVPDDDDDIVVPD